jgi:hypothetical protein
LKKLELSQVEGSAERDNFRKLDEEFQSGNPFLSGEWQLFDREYETTGTFRVPHKLGFKPLDIFVTHDTAGFSYDHNNFTSTEIEITTAGSGRVRFLLGRMR